MVIRPKALLAYSAGFLALHALVMTLAPDQPAEFKANKILASNLFQLLASAAAAYFCWHSTRTHTGFPRKFWRVLGLVPAVWCFAQTIWAIGEVWPNFVFFNENTTLVLFFFSFAPLAYLILMRPDVEQRSTDWSHVLDVMQVIVVMVCVFYWQFYLPTRYETYH